MWRVPPGAVPPTLGGNPDASNPTAPSVGPERTRPYIFTTLIPFTDGVEGCGTVFDPDGYAELLLAEPKARGNVVIYQSSPRRFRAEEKQILGELAQRGVDRRRLKTTFKRSSRGRAAGTIELWVLAL